MFKKKERLTAEDIENMSKAGAMKSVFGTLLSLRFITATEKRMSVVVSKKVASRAVDRVCLRRRLYAASEEVFKNVVPAHIMLMPKKECLAVPFSQLSAEVSALLIKARLLNQ
jgi:ribonuclease P protein component